MAELCEPGFSGLALRFNLQSIVSSGVRLRSTRIDPAARSPLCYDFVHLRRINP